MKETFTHKQNLRVAPDSVVVILKGNEFTSDVFTQDHHIIADEPLSLGGKNLGPAPFDFLLTSLGTCTAMTLRMYINRKEWAVSEIRVQLSYEKQEDTFVIKRHLEIQGEIDEAQHKRLHQIADKCPVHKILSGDIKIHSESI